MEKEFLVTGVDTLELKKELEKFGRPHLRQCQDKLLESITSYIVSVMPPWQFK
jgi:hypothetical protein